MLLLFFCLYALYSLLKDSPLHYTIALLGLLLTNLRGIYLLIALLIIHAILMRRNMLQFSKKLVGSYIVSIGLLGVFFIFQYTELGWFAITQSKNYSAHREVSTFSNIVKNSIIYIKSHLEFGRIFVYGVVGLFILKYFRGNRLLLDRKSKITLLLLLVFMGILFIGFVPFTNPIGPRYFMICYALVNILFITIVFTHFKKRMRPIIIGIAVLFFISGHFWVYPKTIAQPWDSSLAYLNYYPIKDHMLQYVAQQDIAPEAIGTHLRINQTEIASLGKETLYGKFAAPNLSTNSYYLFSNIENHTKDEEIDLLYEEWILLQTFRQNGVFISLFKNPNDLDN